MLCRFVELGITAIELAQQYPPLWEVKPAVRALFRIHGPTANVQAREVVNRCHGLRAACGRSRLSTELMAHPFLSAVCSDVDSQRATYCRMRLRVLPLWSSAAAARMVAVSRTGRVRTSTSQAVRPAIIPQARARASEGTLVLGVTFLPAPIVTSSRRYSCSRRREQCRELRMAVLYCSRRASRWPMCLMRRGRCQEGGRTAHRRVRAVRAVGVGDLVMAARGELVVVVAARRAAAPRGPLRLLRLQRWAQHRRRRLVRAGR